MDNLESEGEGNKKNRDVHPCCKQGSTVVFTNARRMRCNPSWNIIAVRLGFTFHSVVRAYGKGSAVVSAKRSVVQVPSVRSAIR